MLLSSSHIRFGFTCFRLFVCFLILNNMKSSVHKLHKSYVNVYLLSFQNEYLDKKVFSVPSSLPRLALGYLQASLIIPIECFHMTSRQPYWCPKTMKRRPCWCSKPVLWELNSFLMQTLSFVPINLHRCWPREWKHSIRWIIVIYLIISAPCIDGSFIVSKLFIVACASPQKKIANKSFSKFAFRRV